MNSLWALSKRIHRVGLALVLLWQVNQPALLGQFGSDVQYFSQVVLNQGSTASFTINNPSTTETITVNVQVYSTSGQPLTDGQVELGPGATETLDFGDPGAALTTGWAELKSDDEFIATEFFQLSIGGQLKPRVGVLPSVETDAARFLGFVNPQFKSGLAVTNPSATEATEVTIRARDNAGQEPVGPKTLMLEPLQSMAGFLNEETFFGVGLTNYEGVVELSVNSPGVAALSLIQEVATGDVATVSVLTQSHVITDEDENNTAVGVEALNSNTTGNGNTAIGRGALFLNTEGNSNTASGAFALSKNTTGRSNTASGVYALGSNTTGQSNMASGFLALGSNTEGVNNTATGFEALLSNTTGQSNTAIGSLALFNSTTADFNTATGERALLENRTGEGNTASGSQALRNNRTGSDNTAVGRNALFSNDSSWNTAIGSGALESNITGSDNTATGRDALKGNTIGSANTAIGSSALESNTNGLFNTAIGNGSLQNNSEGDFNTAVGFGALFDNTTGGANIAIGWNAGRNLSTGDFNIYIGSNGTEESNTIRIGDNTHTSAFMAGVRLVSSSSRRFKQDIQDMNQASSDLMRLRPVTFRYKKEHDPGDGRRQYGLIAEEVAQVYPELVVVDETGNPKTVEYQKLPAMLLNEIQKQQKVIVELTERLSRLEQVLTAQKALAALPQ